MTRGLPSALLCAKGKFLGNICAMCDNMFLLPLLLAPVCAREIGRGCCMPATCALRCCSHQWVSVRVRNGTCTQHGTAMLLLLLCAIGISTSSTYSCAAARERKAARDAQTQAQAAGAQSAHANAQP